MTPPRERSGRGGVPAEPPDLPLDVGAACRPPGERSRSPKRCGQRKNPRRGQDPALRSEGARRRSRPILHVPKKIPLLWFGGQRTTIYRVPKRVGKNLSKKSKKGVDKGEPGWYYSQAVRRGSAGRQAGKPHRYSLERVSGAESS